MADPITSGQQCERKVGTTRAYALAMRKAVGLNFCTSGWLEAISNLIGIEAASTWGKSNPTNELCAGGCRTNGMRKFHTLSQAVRYGFLISRMSKRKGDKVLS